MRNIFHRLLIVSALTFLAYGSYAQFSLSVGITIRTAPPAMPVYIQPACPTDGYLWTPGYWAYDDVDGYYWVPGVWVRPAQPGYLWTPGYWGFAGGIYGWHGGYWGSHIGFYGGVNYGYGYGGSGFVGGQWQGGYFHYNTAVMNVNTTVVHNTYINRTVINTTVVNNHSSFNGGAGIQAQPNAQEQVAMHENHIQPTSEQFNHNHTASQDRNQFASANGGRPGTTAMNSVGGARFSSQGRTAPAAVARPAGGIRATAYHPAAGGSHPGNAGGGHPGNAGGGHPGNPGGGHPGGSHPNNHPNNHPAAHNPPAEHGGGGEHRP